MRCQAGRSAPGCSCGFGSVEVVQMPSRRVGERDVGIMALLVRDVVGFGKVLGSYQLCLFPMTSLGKRCINTPQR